MLNIRVNHPKNANCWPNTLQSPGGVGVVMYFQRYQHTFLTGYKLHTNNYSIKLGKHSKFVSYSNYNVLSIDGCLNEKRLSIDQYFFNTFPPRLAPLLSYSV